MENTPEHHKIQLLNNFILCSTPNHKEEARQAQEQITNLHLLQGVQKAILNFAQEYLIINRNILTIQESKDQTTHDEKRDNLNRQAEAVQILINETAEKIINKIQR